MLHLRSLSGTYLFIPVHISSTLTDIQASIANKLDNGDISKNRIIVFVDSRFVQNATQVSAKYAIMTHQSRLKMSHDDTVEGVDGMFFIDTSPMVYRCLKSVHNGRTILPLMYESNQRFVHLKMRTLTTQNVFTLADRSGKSLWTYKTFTPGSTIYVKIDLLEWTVDLMLCANTIHRLDIFPSLKRELYIVTNGLKLSEMCETNMIAYDKIPVLDHRKQLKNWCQQLRKVPVVESA